MIIKIERINGIEYNRQNDYVKLVCKNEFGEDVSLIFDDEHFIEITQLVHESNEMVQPTDFDLITEQLDRIESKLNDLMITPCDSKGNKERSDAIHDAIQDMVRSVK